MISPSPQTLKKLTKTFPTHITHLNQLGHTTLPMPISPHNPSIVDRNYHQRRTWIGYLSQNFKIGQPIQEVEYTQKEHYLWRKMFAEAYPYRKLLMSEAYWRNLKELMSQLKFHEQIPRLNDLSQYLKAKSGFQIKPVAGIVSQRQFLNCLAFRVFCCGQFIRHHECEEFAPEPDIVHEYVGHIPTFADQRIAAISQEIGLMSLGASDEDLAQLGEAYLHSLQFGICEEKGAHKVFGAGICGCLADLKKIKQNKFKRVQFNPENPSFEQFDYVVQQNRFWVTPSLETALLKLRKLSKTLDKPFDCQFDQRSGEIKLTMK